MKEWFIHPPASERGHSAIPRASGFDSSVAFLREGYGFVSRRCDHLGSDAFATRIMLKPVICMRGAEAASIFYGGRRFTRRGAMPRSVLHLLQDQGSVQLLDGDVHRVRKRMFMSLMSPDALAQLVSLFAHEFRAAVSLWRQQDRVVLHDGIRHVLTRTVAAWAGVPLTEAEARLRTQELGAMIDKAGTLGPRNWWARRLRHRSEAWARSVIEAVRREEIRPAPDAALAVIADHRDTDGRTLDVRVAAVELLNVLRPTVAVGRFIVFAALALLEHPRWREAFAAGAEDDLEPFVQEVRRFYPFFPAVGGRVHDAFQWHGHRFEIGQWVLLDLYGTNHDARLWSEPAAFRPERFRDWDGNPFTLVPQGAGAYETDHRCPGEWITIALVKEAVRLLTREVRFGVPLQDLSISLTALPALPKSGFMMTGVASARRERRSYLLRLRSHSPSHQAPA